MFSTSLLEDESTLLRCFQRYRLVWTASAAVRGSRTIPAPSETATTPGRRTPGRRIVRPQCSMPPSSPRLRRPDPLLARLAHDRRLPVRHQLPGGLPIPDTRGGVRLVHPVHGLPALARAARRNRAPAPGWGGRRSLPGNRYVDRLRPLPSNNARERAHLSLPAPFCFPGG